MPPPISRISERRNVPAVASYTPFDKGGVINAAAYRAFLLTSASKLLGQRRLLENRRTKFEFRLGEPESGRFVVLRDGWGARFCRSLSHLFRDESPREDSRFNRDTSDAIEALSKGIKYYLKNLFDEDGLPKPFSKAPRLTVYKRELYDCAECINLCLLLRDRFPELERTLGEGRHAYFGSVGQARWFVPLPEITSGLGQRSHASLGTIADVPKPGILSVRSASSDE